MPEVNKRPLLVRRVNLVWYPLALVPILLLGYTALSGWVPQTLVVAAMFLLLFWVFSLVFALIALWRRPRELRQ